MTSGQHGEPEQGTRRPVFLTRLAWVFVVLGGLGLPMSVLALFMVLAGGKGAEAGSLLGGLIVIGGPPSVLVAGIGLLRRRTWAHRYAVGLIVLVAVNSLMQIVRGPMPETRTVSAGVTITTQLATSVDYPWHILTILIALGLAGKLLSRAMRAEFSCK